MGENYRIGENLFVIPVDMENRYVEDIAREAALRIVEICEKGGTGTRREEERKFYPGKTAEEMFLGDDKYEQKRQSQKKKI